MSDVKKERQRVAQQKYYLANREEVLERRRAHYKANRERIKARERARYYSDRPRALEKVARFRLKKAYGMTVEQWRSMFAAQDCKCKVCGTAENSRPWHTDHCHATGAVRGILCHNCNTAIGHFREDAALLRAAAKYIEEFDEVSTVEPRPATREMVDQTRII